MCPINSIMFKFFKLHWHKILKAGNCANISPYMICICNKGNKCVQLVALHSNLANYGDIKYIKSGDSANIFALYDINLREVM